MKLIWFAVGLAIALFFMSWADHAQAQDKASLTLDNGAMIILTDEACDMHNPKDGKLIQGKKARGVFQGQTNPACWVFQGGLIYVLFFKPDGKSVEGLNYYRPDSFRSVVGS